MLSDEERKAIDYLQLCYDLSTITNESLSKLGIVLNLIEKQSKEIEELKDKYNIKLLSNAGIYQLGFNDGIKSVENKIKAKIEEKFLEAKGLYERGVQPQAQYTMKLLRDLEKSLLEKEGE